MKRISEKKDENVSIPIMQANTDRIVNESSTGQAQTTGRFQEHIRSGQMSRAGLKSQIAGTNQSETV